MSGRNNDNNSNNDRGSNPNTKRDGDGTGDSTWGDKDTLGRVASVGSSEYSSDDSSRLQRPVEQDRVSTSTIPDSSGETNRIDSDSGNTSSYRQSSRSSSSRSERENRSSRPRKSTQARSSQGEKSASTIWDSVKEPEIASDFGTSDLPKDINLTIEDLSKLVYSCFGGLASLGGDHWKITQVEAKELAQAMKKLPITKNNRLFKLIARNAPYLNFAMVAGSLLMPRVLISYYEYQSRRQEIEEDKARRANSRQNQQGHHQQDFSSPYSAGVEREYNIIN